jgi:hypothetical protein
MTTVNLQKTLPTSEDRLRSVLLIDSIVVTTLFVALAASPASWYGDLPVRVLGIVGAVLAADVFVFSRWSGRKLRIGAVVTAEAALAWSIATVVLIEVGDVRGAGLELLALSGLATLVFGILETRLVRALR